MSRARRASPTLATLLQAALDVRLAQTRVAIPGEVIAYDAATQTVDVQPKVEAILPVEGGHESYELTPVRGAPVVFPQAGGYFISFPIQPGDPVLLVVCDRSLDEWTRGQPNTRSKRTHDITDAVAIPGMRPQVTPLQDASADTMAMGRDGGAQIHIRPDRIDLGSKDVATLAARADRVEQVLTALKNAISAAGVAPMDGGATFKSMLMGALSSWPSPGSTATDKVRAD